MAKRDEQRAEAVSQALDTVDPAEADPVVLARARRTEAVSMALAGLTYEQIGERLKISPSGAYELVRRTLADTRNYAVDGLREVENARLDRAQAAIWSKVLEGDLAAIRTYLQISRERRALNGMDAPTKIQMSVSVRQEMEQALHALEELVVDAEVVEPGQVAAVTDVAADEEAQATMHDYGIIDPVADDDA